VRTIGAGPESQWGTAQWGIGTWAAPAATSRLPGVLQEDPGSSDGVSIGSRALGSLRFVVEALDPNLGAGGRWGIARWGVDTWADTVGDWYDITSRVRGLTWTLGPNSPDALPQVGQATITLENIDGEASPWATSGVFVGADSRPWLRTGCLVRFGILCNDIAHAPLLSAYNPFFTGRILSVDEDTSDNADAWVTLAITETTADLSITPPDMTTVAGRGLAATILAALGNAGYPFQTSLRVPDEDTTVGAVTLTGKSAKEQLDRLAAGLHWAVVADGRGVVECVRRGFAETDSGYTFSNAPTGGELPLIDVKPYSNRERMLNQGNAARDGATPVTITDSASVQRFGFITDAYGFPRADLVLETDDEVRTLLRRVVSLYAWDDLGIDSVDIDADVDGFVRLPAALTYFAARGREGTAFRVRWVHPSGNTLNEFALVTTQKHAITMVGSQLKWTASFGLEHFVTSAT
jgi:hypothetical protein